jgi:hypothetical protein
MLGLVTDYVKARMGEKSTRQGATILVITVFFAVLTVALFGDVERYSVIKDALTWPFYAFGAAGVLLILKPDPKEKPPCGP